MKKYIGLAIVSVLVGLVVWQFMNEPEVQISTEEPADNSRAIVATDFTLPGLNGEDFTLSQTRGKMTIINFFISKPSWDLSGPTRIRKSFPL